MRWPRPRPQRPVYDIVTPTEHEALEADIRARRRRYFRVMGPCLALVVFGFLVPAPQPVRVAALVVAAVLPPIAAMVGNTSPWRGRPPR
jgi:hypothetical protein